MRTKSNGLTAGLPRRVRAILKFVYLALIALALFLGNLGAEDRQDAIDLRIIVVDSATKADGIVQRLKNGEDFAALARESSIDPTSSDGGYMGKVDPSSLRSELRNAIKGVAQGQISEVVHLPSGYAILKVVPPNDAAALQNTSPGRILTAAATGAIRYAPNVGGKGEADLAFRPGSAEIMRSARDPVGVAARLHLERMALP